MASKIAFISQARLSKLLNNERSKAQWQVEFELYECIAEQNKSKMHELDQRRDIEVIVAGGGNAAMLEAMQLNTPLVEIQISGFDVMQALWQAQRLAKSAVFISYNQPIDQLDRYASLFNLKVEQHTFNSVAQAIDTVLRVIQQPDSIIIGASHVCDIADSLQAQSVFIYSQDAIHQALESAQQLAFSLRAEREKREKLEAILHAVQDGIIYIDADMKVEELNPAAEAILGLDAKDSINQPIFNVIPNSGLEQVIRSKKPQYNQLLTIGKTQILSNRMGVFNQGKLIGAVASFQDVKTVRKAEQSLRLDTQLKNLVAKNTLESIVGNNIELKKLIDKAGHFAKTDATILIQGATGTGKELIAQGIHLASKRASRPFVAVNCASIPEPLLESTLFGYDEGAFTGANKNGKAGLFELSNKGTIFLDEIGELPFSLQGRLLRVLQEKEVMRLGSDTVLPIDSRIIAATNRDLKLMVSHNHFKEDLFYRLNVLNLSVPTLSERLEDIPLFAQHFFKLKQVPATVYAPLLDKSLTMLLDYSWPGNVRELENLIERLSIMFNAEMPIADIEEELVTSLGMSEKAHELASSLHKNTQQIERQQLQAVLLSCNNNKAQTARKLGISRSTLWRKLKNNN
ncbi:MAG: sigma 54-interacting transcriptional regulator [Oceanospirillaceae bacterium]